ncbi:MAG: prepilin-type N-terminal cleavage/methylation domain-containing protein [Deltaproteobacteria bacterium]|nr:prepilin-type N-terminal cleavage/methylation domain-containing protein [Deltaproteobacteria bacterium]
MKERGFSLLEVMIAMAILAVALAAIASSNSLSIIYGARVNRLTTASLLMEGVVNDIEDYYRRKGFPSNNLEGKLCDVPKKFERNYECRYDLKGVKITPDMVQAIVQESMNNILSGAAWEDLGSQDKDGNKASGTGLDPSKIAMLAPLFGPQGEELIVMCNINISALITGITGLVSYMPQIIDEIGRQTRKLAVTLSWKEGPAERKELKIETFIVSIPEEEMEKIRQAEEMKNLIESGIPPGGSEMPTRKDEEKNKQTR